MCLLIFAHQASDEHPLIIAANRDEFHARPTRPANLWDDHPRLLAGKDMEQGGTWMGITRDGRFAAITNYRDPDQGNNGTAPPPRSRGELPLNFLIANSSPEQYMAALQTEADQYAGFNLLVGDAESLWYYANSDAAQPRKLSPGVYGLSNASLDTPWPKVELGKARLNSLMASGTLDHDALATLVSDTRTAPAEALETLGIEGEMAQVLSSQFIITPGYGTRSTTTLRTERDGTIHWREQAFDSAGVQTGVSELVLTI